MKNSSDSVGRRKRMQRGHNSERNATGGRDEGGKHQMARWAEFGQNREN